MTLHEYDEYLHQPPDPVPPRWQENMFFICWDLATGTGLLCHTQRAPAEGIQHAQVAIAVNGTLVATCLTGPYDRDRLAPGVIAEPLEPFRRWHVGITGHGSSSVGPHGLFAARPGGSTPFSADVVLESTLPIADFAEGLADVVRGMRADRAGPQMGDQQHYEQGGTWRGRLRIGDDEIETSGLFVRDHSWGIRHEHGQFKAFWTAACLDEGRLFTNAIGIPNNGETMGIGVVVDESGATFTTDVDAAFRPAPGIGSYDTTTVTFGDPIGRTLTARTDIHVPIYLPHSGPGRYDSNAISRVTLGGVHGFGVMEWAGVLTDAQRDDLDAETVAP